MVLRLKARESRSPPGRQSRQRHTLSKPTPSHKPNAGWSSPVARQAHNLKVIGSNPIPATKIKPGRSGTPPFLPGVFVCDGQRPPSSARRKIVDRNAAPQGDREGEFQLAREDDRAVIGLGALQEVADFNVRIAVV